MSQLSKFYVPPEGKDTFWELLPQRDAFFSAWDGTIDKSLDGTGLPDSPFLIKTAAQLAGFADIVNSGNNSAYARLMTNIDLRNIEWRPIGNIRDIPKFAGFFDGNGYVIKNLKVTKASGAAGFFGAASGSYICNLIILDAYIYAENNKYAGILLGYNRGIVINSHSEGMLKGKNIIGGGIGLNEAAEIVKHSGSSTDIIGENNIGGFIGLGNRPGFIYRCYSNGVVNSKGDGVGGFIGVTINFQGIPSILYSVASVDVSGEKYIGGFAGTVGPYSEVFNCYSTGDVEGSIGAGGFVGLNRGFISHSYSSGNVKGLDSVGGFIGEYYHKPKNEDKLTEIEDKDIVDKYRNKLGRVISCGWLQGDATSNNKLPNIGKGLIDDEKLNIKSISDIETLESNISIEAYQRCDPQKYKASSIVYLKTRESKGIILDTGVNKPSIISVSPENIGGTSIIYLGNRIGILGSTESEEYNGLITVSYVTDSSLILKKQFRLFIGEIVE
jgi:hypothetical protein